MIMVNETSVIGNQTERMFDVLAQANNWLVGIPCNTSLEYDRIISFDNGISWKRIQIKNAFNHSKARAGSDCWAVKVKSSNGILYSDSVDYIAANVKGTFYMFPCSVWEHCVSTFSFCLHDYADYCIGDIVIHDKAHELKL